ncbi:MAG: multidrug ABC transporter ATP-binding protein, partial [Chloroflexi bacterium RBG_19FT_COMBO_49_13]
MSAVRIEELRKVFGTFQALDGLSLTVEGGTVFGFLGPNGAGKTTTIRILTGLAHATSGHAWVLGKEVTANGRETARHIGYLPEEPAFYPWMTPREFLDFVGRVFGLPAAERSSRTNELLALAGLEEAAKRRIGGFSRGMRQRLALAQALLNHPEVLFMDEPASALDPEGRKEVLDFIGSLRGQCTVFMSTHILADVERVCDTVGIINQG